MISKKIYKNWRQLKFGFEVAEKWYNHKAETVLENKQIKIVWVMKVQAGKVLEHSCPDINFLTRKKIYQMIDTACPLDTHTEQKRLIITMN